MRFQHPAVRSATAQERPNQRGDDFLTLERFQAVSCVQEVRMVCARVLRLVVFFAFGSALIVYAQHQHEDAARRGAMVMGFDQARTSHRFSLFADGGAIDVSVKDPADAKNRDAIRSHLPHIAVMFGSGDFHAPMLVHQSSNVPGTSVMAERKQNIRYEYAETPNGGRVNIVTTDPEALAAVHAFLRFQITDHKTGDPTMVRPR
jgi:hypothetical protein